MNTTETAAPTQAHYEGPGVVSQTLLGAGALGMAASIINSLTESGRKLTEAAALNSHLATAEKQGEANMAAEYRNLLQAGEKEFSAAARRSNWIAGAGALIGGALSYFSARGARQQFEKQNATIAALHGQVQEISAQRDTMAAHIVTTQEHKEHPAIEHAAHHHTTAAHEGHAAAGHANAEHTASAHHSAPATAIHASTAEHQAPEHAQHHHTAATHEGHAAAAKHRAEAAPEHHARG